MSPIRVLSVLLVVCGLVVGGGTAVAAAQETGDRCSATNSQMAVTDTDANTEQTVPINATVERAPGHLPPSEALAAATPNQTIQPDDWLVLTVDVGSVLDSVDESTVLAASQNGAAGVTLSMRQTNPPASLQPHEIPIDDLTRCTDAANGTITYFYDGASPTLRGGEPSYQVNLTVATANERVSRRHTVGASVRIQSPELQLGGDRLNDDPRSRELLPTRPNVTVPLSSSFSPEKPLNVSLVEANGTVLTPARTVTMDTSGSVPVTFDLSTVASGTDAAIVVTDGHTGRKIATKRVVVDQRADPEIRDISQQELLSVDGSGRVNVTVENEGTAVFEGSVTASFDGTTHTERVQISPAEETTVTFTLQTPASADRADFRASVGNSSDFQLLAVGGPTFEFVQVDSSVTGKVVISPQRDRALEVTAGLTNPSVWPATTTVTATIANQTVRTQVSVPSGNTSQTTLSVPVGNLSTGSYRLVLRTDNDTVTRTLAVTSETPTPTEGTQTPGTNGAGLGVVAAILALLSSVWLKR